MPSLTNFGSPAIIQFGLELSIDNKKVTVRCPTILCIYSHQYVDDTLNLFTILSRVSLSLKYEIILDLSGLELITASAAVMLFAEISRIQIVTNNPGVITIIKPKSRDLIRLFTASGLWSAIKPGTLRKLEKLKKEGCQFQSSTDHQSATASIVSALKSNGFDLTNSDIRIFTKGVQEAMLNVMHHAYSNIDDPKSGIGKRWWQAFWYNKIKKSFSFIIYDKGMGIPATLKNQSMSGLLDHEIIKKSLERGITRLADASRGKGSIDIQNVTSISERSTLLIASSKGYVIKKRDNDKLETSSINHSFNGTLIEWAFELEGMK